MPAMLAFVLLTLVLITTLVALVVRIVALTGQTVASAGMRRVSCRRGHNCREYGGQIKVGWLKR